MQVAFGVVIYEATTVQFLDGSTYRWRSCAAEHRPERCLHVVDWPKRPPVAYWLGQVRDQTLMSLR